MYVTMATTFGTPKSGWCCSIITVKVPHTVPLYLHLGKYRRSPFVCLSLHVECVLCIIVMVSRL